jgi:hypothetical protein
VEVYRRPASEVDITLAAAIPRRRTDRRHYSSWSVPSNYIALMGARAARAGVMLRQVEALPRLQHIVSQAVWRHATDHDYLTELTTWSGRYASLAGVPAHNAPQSDPAAPVPPRLFAGPALAQPPGTDSVHDNAAVLALGTKDDSTLARLRAGEATSLVLLSATAQGLASCPITEPLEISETRDAVQIEVFGISGFPQMLLRVGQRRPVTGDSAPPTERDRRLSGRISLLLMPAMVQSDLRFESSQVDVKVHDATVIALVLRMQAGVVEHLEHQVIRGQDVCDQVPESVGAGNVCEPPK